MFLESYKSYIQTYNIVHRSHYLHSHDGIPHFYLNFLKDNL